MQFQLDQADSGGDAVDPEGAHFFHACERRDIV
jgi:hypothetical protein